MKYRAPALEKGLDILEVLARSATPMNMLKISAEIRRSKGEIFRMLQVLQDRGYIERRPGDEGYTLTHRLFMLGMEQPPVKGLLETALPAMHRLSEAIWQSCHLAVASREQMVVIARVDAPGDIAFAVRVGYRRPLPQSASGLVLFAFQPDQIRRDWLETFDETRCVYDQSQFIERANHTRERGFAKRPSDVVRGVTDLSAPILQHNCAVAALTVPFVERDSLRVKMDDALNRVQEFAAEISHALQFGSASRSELRDEVRPVTRHTAPATRLGRGKSRSRRAAARGSSKARGKTE